MWNMMKFIEKKNRGILPCPLLDYFIANRDARNADDVPNDASNEDDGDSVDDGNGAGDGKALLNEDDTVWKQKCTVKLAVI
jgi:hypothetical protein